MTAQLPPWNHPMAVLLWSRVCLAKEFNRGPGRGFRYDIAEFVQETWPSKGTPGKIPVSIEARRCLDQGLKVRYEHSVPLSVIFKAMLETETIEQMVSVVERLYQAAFVSIDEDRAISRIGLHSRMPAGWNGDVMARYSVAGIAF